LLGEVRAVNAATLASGNGCLVVEDESDIHTSSTSMVNASFPFSSDVIHHNYNITKGIFF
jgi:hypothetical protein